MYKLGGETQLCHSCGWRKKVIDQAVHENREEPFPQGRDPSKTDDSDPRPCSADRPYRQTKLLCRILRAKKEMMFSEEESLTTLLRKKA